MKRVEIYFGILRIVTDALVITGALMLAYWLRARDIDLIPGVQILEPAQTLPTLKEYEDSFVSPAVILFLVIAALLKLYLIRVTLSAFREISRIILSTIVWMGLIMGWYFLVQRELFFSRAILLHSTIFIIVFVSAGRSILTFIQRLLLTRGIGVRSVLSIGANPLPDVVERFLRSDARYNYLGHVSSFDSAQDDTRGRLSCQL